MLLENISIPPTLKTSHMVPTILQLTESHPPPSKHYALGKQKCVSCGYKNRHTYGMLKSYMCTGLSSRQEYPNGVSLHDCIMEYQQGREVCLNCGQKRLICRLSIHTTLNDIPTIMFIDIGHDKLFFNEELTYDVGQIEAERHNIWCTRAFYVQAYREGWADVVS